MQLDLTELSTPLLELVQELDLERLRPELTVAQIPSPKGLAPQSFALSVNVDHQDNQVDHGVSRLVFAYDSDVPEGWNSELRVIGYAKSPIDLEMARDEYLSSLPWEWLRDSLVRNGARFAHDAGTSTTVISTGHGTLIGQPQHAELEIRASWAPMKPDLMPHLIGWGEMLSLMSGLPPIDEKVRTLSRG